MLASRALNLAAGIVRFALQWLITVDTVEFEFISIHSLYTHKRKRPTKSMLGYGVRGQSALHSEGCPILLGDKVRLIWYMTDDSKKMDANAQREAALFQAAAQLTGAVRKSFLDNACLNDPALR